MHILFLMVQQVLPKMDHKIIQYLNQFLSILKHLTLIIQLRRGNLKVHQMKVLKPPATSTNSPNPTQDILTIVNFHDNLMEFI